MKPRLLLEFDDNPDFASAVLFDADGFTVEQTGNVSAASVATYAALCREYSITAGQANTAALRVSIRRGAKTLYIRGAGSLRLAIELENTTKFGLAEVLADRVQQRCLAFVPNRQE